MKLGDVKTEKPVHCTHGTGKKTKKNFRLDGGGKFVKNDLNKNGRNRIYLAIDGRKLRNVKEENKYTIVRANERGKRKW